MILLGSIQRVELLHLLEQHIGKDRRVQVAAKCAEEAEQYIDEEQPEENPARNASPKGSRFAVTKVPEITVQVIDEDKVSHP